jgi:hypothetical protein
MNKKLSPKQMNLYIKMDYTWKSAYELRARLDTLQAVVKKGYAESYYGLGSSAFPRSCIMFRRTNKPIA